MRWVARLDKRGRVHFAPLQGELAKAHGLAENAAAEGGTMVLMRESDGRLFTRSAGLIELARALGGAWNLLRVAWLIPGCLRDRVYQWIADHRYSLMGGHESCGLPSPELKDRLRK